MHAYYDMAIYTNMVWLTPYGLLILLLYSSKWKFGWMQENAHIMSYCHGHVDGNTKIVLLPYGGLLSILFHRRLLPRMKVLVDAGELGELDHQPPGGPAPDLRQHRLLSPKFDISNAFGKSKQWNTFFLLQNKDFIIFYIITFWFKHLIKHTKITQFEIRAYSMSMADSF